MFTGIIEEIGKVASLTRKGNGTLLKVEARITVRDIKEGDSVAVNGVCLTITGLSKDSFSTFIMHQTLRQSNLSLLHNGSYLNLERALRQSDRLSGHIVYGHIDGIARLTVKRADSITISLPHRLLGPIVDKASIALDGISLTVQSKRGNTVNIAITPFTHKHTTIRYWRTGTNINVETDKGVIRHRSM